MRDRLGSRRARLAGFSVTALVGVALVALVVVAGALAGGARCHRAAARSTLNENAWAGSTSNVVRRQVRAREEARVQGQGDRHHRGPAELPGDGATARSTPCSRTGRTSPRSRSTRRTSSLVNLGSNGITGVIGWYIPRYLLKQYPQFKTWKGLKGKESVFKSPESGSQGMFLGGDPSYVQKDRALIKGLGLNLKHVVAGAEPAQVARWSQLYKQKKPVLFYWYDPQYLNAQYDLVQVQLPARFKGCQDDEKKGGDAKQYACAYPSYRLDKVISGKFAKSGSPAVSVIKKFKWTSSRPEHGREPDRRQEDEAGQGGRAVGEGEPRQGQRLAREVDVRVAAVRRSPRPPSFP